MVQPCSTYGESRLLKRMTVAEVNGTRGCDRPRKLYIDRLRMIWVWDETQDLALGTVSWRRIVEGSETIFLFNKPYTDQALLVSNCVFVVVNKFQMCPIETIVRWIANSSSKCCSHVIKLYPLLDIHVDCILYMNWAKNICCTIEILICFFRIVRSRFQNSKPILYLEISRFIFLLKQISFSTAGLFSDKCFFFFKMNFKSL